MLVSYLQVRWWAVLYLAFIWATETTVCSGRSFKFTPAHAFLSIASSWNLFIVDESLKIAAEAWSESQNRKLFLWHKQLTTKVKICIVVAWEYAKKCQHVWYNVLTFYKSSCKTFWSPLVLLLELYSVETYIFVTVCPFKCTLGFSHNDRPCLADYVYINKICCI